MASHDHRSKSDKDNMSTSFIDEFDLPKVQIHHKKVMNENRGIDVLFTVIEVLIWQLVNRGVLPEELLADELLRHARFHSMDKPYNC